MSAIAASHRSRVAPIPDYAVDSSVPAELCYRNCRQRNRENRQEICVEVAEQVSVKSLRTPDSWSGAVQSSLPHRQVLHHFLRDKLNSENHIIRKIEWLCTVFLTGTLRGLYRTSLTPQGGSTDENSETHGSTGRGTHGSFSQRHLLRGNQEPDRNQDPDQVRHLREVIRGNERQPQQLHNTKGDSS